MAAAMLALSSNAQTVISVAEAITTGSALPKNGYTTTECIVLGYVVSVVDYSPALGYQTFYLADDQANSLGQTFQAYQCTIDNYGEKAKVLVGDQVTVTGKIKNHNGTLIEIPSGKTEFQTMVEGDHTVPTSFKSINVSKALTDGAALASNGYSEEAYWVVGYVSNIQEDKFSSDGWQTFWIADDASSTAKTNADGAFEVYRGKPSDAVKVGDRVRVLTRLYYYKGTTVETETYVTVESAEVNVDFTDVYWAYDPKADEWYLNGNSSAYALGLYTAPGKIKNFTSLLGMFSTADFDLEKSSIYAFGSQHKILSIEAILSPVSMDPLIIEANMTIMAEDLVIYTVHMIKNYPTGVYGGRTVASKTMKIYDYTEEYGFYILYGSTPDGYDISCYVYGSDFTGTWTINKNAQAYVSYSGENPVACDGSFTVTKDDKVVKLTGSFTCFDEYSYSVTMEKNISGTPWVENLQDAGYDLTNNVVLCVKFTDDAVACNSIYFIGTFTSWNLDMTYQFTELPQFPGWYVCSVVYDAGFQGKPIHVDYKGNLTWKFQPGDVKAWKHVGGYDASIFDNGYDGESNAEFASAGAYIYEISYWKKHKNPCVPVPTHKYTINVYPPVCETMEYDLALVGEFNDWNGVAMEKMVDKDNKTYYSYVLNAEEEQEYLFCESNEALWQNRIMVYDADLKLFNPMSNYSLPETKEENPVITLDLSDPAKYQWEKCFSTAPECYLGLSMTDMYSDGWNNGYLTVSDGSYNGIYTLRTGGYKQVKIPYFGNEMNFSWTTGSWPEEVGFTILASNGVPLFNHEQNTSLYDGLVYTLKSSPCSSSANPFAPKNIIAKLNEYRQMAIVWDAVDGAASYSITVTTPTNEFLVNNMAINELTYTTGALVDDGDYKITLVAFDKNNVQLGATTTKVNIVLPKVEQAEITIMAPSDCGLDVTNGIWMSWRKTGETGWPNVVKMSTEDNIFFTTTIKPNAVTYDYMFTNGDPDVEGTLYSYYYWTNSTQTKLCREISYSGGDKWIYVDWADCDKMANHDYRPYNLKAVPTPGRVDFSWEQKDASKQFMIQIYDAVTESVIDGFYCSDTKSYSWGIPASLVGNQVYWG